MDDLDLGFIPSNYQKAIFNDVINGSGNMHIEATAGSGKSSTIVAIGKILNAIGIPGDNILFLAFNKLIVDDLKAKVGEKFTCRTLNSLGHSVLSRRIKHKLILEPKKYQNIFNDLLENNVKKEELFDTMMVMKDLLGKYMAELANPNLKEIFKIVSHYGIDLPNSLSDDEFVVKLIRDAIEIGQNMAKSKGIISFDEQIYLPALWKWTPPVYSWVLCDEAQDLSKAKLALALSAVSLTGRFVSVADKNQSVYSFAGADCNSVDNIITQTNPVIFPLSVCYRCPKNVVRLAQTLVPHIEHAPNAIDGVITTIQEHEFLSNPKLGSVVLCRKTNPLVSLAINLIANRIGAKVLGREIGTQIKKTMKEIMGRHIVSMATFQSKLMNYKTKKRISIASRPDHEFTLQNFEDKILCVEVIVQAYTLSSVSEFNNHVDELFSDDASVITLLTIHRAKGLEYDDVYIYDPKLMPLRWKGQKSWEYQQEMNLKYVALTRTKRNLTFIEVPKK